MHQDFAAPERADLDAPVWAVMGGKLFRRAFIMPWITVVYPASKSKPLSKTLILFRWLRKVQEVFHSLLCMPLDRWVCLEEGREIPQKSLFLKYL